MDDSLIVRSTHRGHGIEVVLSQAAEGWRAAWRVYRVTPFGPVANGVVDGPRRRLDQAHAAAKHDAVASIDEHVHELAKEVATRRATA